MNMQRLVPSRPGGPIHLSPVCTPQYCEFTTERSSQSREPTGGQELEVSSVTYTATYNGDRRLRESYRRWCGRYVHLISII